MIVPSPSVSEKEPEPYSSPLVATDDLWDSDSTCANAKETSPDALSDLSAAFNDPRVQDAYVVQDTTNLLDGSECSSSSKDQTLELPNASIQYPPEHPHVYIQHPVQRCQIHQASKGMRASSSTTSHRNVASTSRTAITPMCDPPTGVMSICGTRREMEDSVTIAHRFLQLPCKQVGGCSGACPSHPEEQGAELPLHFFGVYDGHGGSQVSKFCKERLHITLVKEIQATGAADQTSTGNSCILWEKNWEKVMFATFLKIDAAIEGLSWKGISEDKDSMGECISEPIAPETVGSTAVVAVVGMCQIIVANCGDSRAVLSRGGQAMALSFDHKPNREDEMERIEAAGGRVICWNGYRVFGVLAMSRAIGDRYLKPYVIAEPEVMCISRSEDDDCLILASDGLWDVLTNEEACNAARKCLSGGGICNDESNSSVLLMGSNEKNAEAAAVLLTKMALAQGSNDNISVVVVDLRDRKRS